MKKLFAFISILAVAASAMFADLSVKKNADGSYEATFFYGNPRATEVLLAGNFTDWQNGALPMTKGEKGFSITKTLPASQEKVVYKFISDGNWTADLKAPEFVDDGFGGKNSQGVLAELCASDDAGAAGKAKINFISWSMIGLQANYRTQGVADPTKKGMDLDSVTVGMKSYDKFAGNFLPNCPLYIEIALAETELEDYAHKEYARSNQIYLYQKDANDNEVVEWEDGLKNLINGLAANPVAYLSRANDGGSNPFLGHLKFGFNTPYINYLTGFNYAKPDVRQAITWTTVDGHWDAGYLHVGGFNVFSLGDKAVATLEEATGLTWDIGFAPNKTADRKGSKYGYWAWAGVKKDELAIDFQSNGMYDKTLFDDPVEHDFILGAKMNGIDAGDGKISFAAQALLATHQADTAKIKEYNAGNITDYFGYSTDVFYRSGDFDGIKNMAGNVKASYEAEAFSVAAEYRFRGAEASMLYVRENFDDGTFDLSEMLGNLNTQKVTLDVSVNPLEALKISLNASAEMALESLDSKEDAVKGYEANLETWYRDRCKNWVDPLFKIDGGARFEINPSVSYNVTENITIGAYTDLRYKAFKYTENGVDEDKANKYSYADNAFAMKSAGASVTMKDVNDSIKGINVYYGLDLSNDVRHFNTLVGQVLLPMDITASAAIGLKTENTLSADNSFVANENNPFAFAVGISKKFQAMQKPTVYAQFVYNMDPFKHFGDGQDNLNLDRANVKGSWANCAAVGDIDPVDWYDGRAAMRVGIRWDI